jgi:hypothetical protein
MAPSRHVGEGFHDSRPAATELGRDVGTDRAETIEPRWQRRRSVQVHLLTAAEGFEMDCHAGETVDVTLASEE